VPAHAVTCHFRHYSRPFYSLLFSYSRKIQQTQTTRYTKHVCA